MKRAVTRKSPTRASRFESAHRALLVRRASLLRRRRDLADDEAALNEEQEPDWEDAAAVHTTSELLANLGTHELVELERIAEALRRIEAGTYGRCAVCGEAISQGRLEAIPEAVTCTDCTYSN